MNEVLQARGTKSLGLAKREGKKSGGGPEKLRCFRIEVNTQRRESTS